MKAFLKRMLAVVLMMGILIPIPAKAAELGSTGNDKESFFVCNVNDEQGKVYSLYYYKDAFYIKDNSYMDIGGGLGRCPVNKNKTFTYKITREQAKNVKKALDVGSACATSLSTLIGVSFPASVALSIIGFIGGDNAYRSAIVTFLNSGKPSAKLVIKAHCVSRPPMYGEPTYDYEIDNVRITY